MKIFKSKKYSIASYILKYSFIIVFALTIIFVGNHKVFAVCPDGTDSNSCSDGTDGGGTKITTSINNPLNSDIDSIPKFIEALIKIVLTVGVPIVVLAVIYVGFLFVKAQGNSEELTKAKQALLYTLIGAALLLGAFVIANAIQATVVDITKTT